MGGPWRVRDKLYSCPYCKRMGGFLFEAKGKYEVWRCSKCLQDTSRLVKTPVDGGRRLSNKGDGPACLRYGRISRASERSLAEKKQDEATKAYWEKNLKDQGYRDAGFWFDEDTSAAVVPFMRRKYARDLYEQSRPGDIIVTQFASRTFRSILDTGITLERLAQKGVSLFIMDAPWDLSTDTGKALSSLLIACGQMEVGFIRERILNDKAARIKAGKPCSGSAVIGWKVATVAGQKEYVPDEDKRAMALGFLAKLEAGKALKTVVAEADVSAPTVYKYIRAARAGFPHPKEALNSPESVALREKKRLKKRLRIGKAFLDSGNT